ncbi:MAG: peptide deformylase [Cyanobacteria bacterium J06642_2]
MASASISVPKKKVAKPPLDIHTMGDRVLRQDAKRVSQVNDEIRQLVRDMLQTMYSADGIGLAAPQVGVHKRLIVIDPDPQNTSTPPLVLINPEIRGYGNDIVLAQEGCLSIPDVYLDVKRPEAIEVTFKDERGRPRRAKMNGLAARVVQHEIDHLEGVLFVDRVENAILRDRELKQYGFNSRDVIPLT